jgi:ABC-type sugar transport system ATPase subunit
MAGVTPAAYVMSMMVFQQYRFIRTSPCVRTLNFRPNLRILKTPQDEINCKVTEVAEVLQDQSQARQQSHGFVRWGNATVSIGRALVRQPLYLMDEPLESSLDAKLRFDLRIELKHSGQFRCDVSVSPMIRSEAMTMATHAF